MCVHIFPAGCTLGSNGDAGANITLHFDKDLLMHDAVMVLDPTGQTIDLDDQLAGMLQWLWPALPVFHVVSTTHSAYRNMCLI